MTVQPRQEHPLWVQWFDLLQMELTNWRWAWRTVLISGIVTPLFAIFLLGAFAQQSDPKLLVYVLTGNLVLSLLFGAMNNVQGRFQWLRFNGGIEYFATLPIQRWLLVLAVVTTFLLFSIPSILTTLLLGAFWLGVPIQLNPLLLVVIPLCAAPLAGVGALLGLVGRTPIESHMLTTLTTFCLTVIGPVMITPDRLPPWLVAVGYLSPATYAASALRQAAVGPVTSQLFIDGAVLLSMAACFLWVVASKLQWRQMG